MSLIALIEFLKQVKEYEKKYEQVEADKKKLKDEQENCTADLKIKERELLELQKEEENKKIELQNATKKFITIKKDIEKYKAKPQPSETLETHYSQLCSQIEMLEKKTHDFDRFFRRVLSCLTDSNVQASFKQLIDTESNIKREIYSIKRRSKRKNELKKKKRRLKVNLKKISASFLDIKKTKSREMEYFLVYKNQPSKIKREIKALNKKRQEITGKINQLRKKNNQQTVESLADELKIEKKNRKKEENLKEKLQDQLERKKQQMDTINEEITILKKINLEVLKFLNQKQIASDWPYLVDVDSHDRGKTTAIIEHLKRYVMGTVLPQDKRMKENL